MATNQSDLVTEAIIEDQLVELWPEYPCLYDVRSTEFKNRDKRDSALSEMADKLGQSVDWIKAKLKALRNSYTKAKKPQSSGSARKNLSKRSIWLLDKLQFLSPYIASRASISNLDPVSHATTSDSELIEKVSNKSFGEDIAQDDESISSIQDDGEVDCVITKSTKEPLKKKQFSFKRKQDDEELQMLKGIAQSISERNKRQKTQSCTNAVSTFGCYVAEALAELDPQTRHFAQHQINDILFQAQFGNIGMQNQFMKNVVATQPPQHTYPQFTQSPVIGPQFNPRQNDHATVIRRPFGFPSNHEERWSADNQQPRFEQLQYPHIQNNLSRSSTPIGNNERSSWPTSQEQTKTDSHDITTLGE